MVARKKSLGKCLNMLQAQAYIAGSHLNVRLHKVTEKNLLNTLQHQG